jgi:hypothetical protein
MEKTGQRKTYRDPALNKIVQEKAAWNKQVSALINDIIHFKKSMNGWPSKYYKERTRITQPVPIDLGGILGQIAGEFQEITNRGNAILQEQSDFAKSRTKRHTERTLDRLEQTRGLETPQAPAGAPAKPDLAKEIGKGMTAADNSMSIVKLASELEAKYELESIASNPFSRFITRLFNPKFGFGEGARIRRLRMTMLDNCVKSYKALKGLHKEIVKSGKGSIVNSHKMMTSIWNYWNAVNRLFSTYKAIRPTTVVADEGGPIEEDEELKKERAIEEGRDPDEPQAEPVASNTTANAVAMIRDYKANVTSLGSDPEIARRLQDLNSIVDRILAAPAGKKVSVVESSGIEQAYQEAIRLVNAEWGTTGSTFRDIVSQKQAQSGTKTAQRQLGKLRHQLIPGATSGQRLEIYKFITQIKKDLDSVMNLLEAGFDQEQLSTTISQVNREMSTLRTMMRSLYYSEMPGESPSTFF